MINLLIHPALADFPPNLWQGICTPGQTSCDISSLSDIVLLLQNLIQIALTLAGVLAVAFIIFGGIQYITSSGDAKRVEGAKNTLVNAVIGLVLAALAYVIVGYVVGIFS